MRIALISQFYWPSVGGVQRVVQEIAEGLSNEGHDVEILTSHDPARSQAEFNGVKIVSFKISGNTVQGLSGEVEEFQSRLLTVPYDCVFIYAAQQWGLDAALPVLANVKARKIHVPCGYSALYNPQYESYFEKMKKDLRLFDALIFHSEHYRDYEFAVKAGCKNLFVIPNGASLPEFEPLSQKGIRERLQLGQEKLLVTVGSPPFGKGHLDALRAFRSPVFDQSYALVLNGNYEIKNLSHLLKECVKFFLGRSLLNIWLYKIYLVLFFGKKIRVANFRRKELLSLLTDADLFIFFSHIEYSPLVLFEAVASGTPFVSTPCGNAKEIAKWTKGGIVARKEEIPSLVVDLLNDRSRYAQLAQEGRRSFLERYNWDVLVKEYIRVFSGES